MKEIEKWNKWLLDNKNINVQIYLSEYKLELKQQDKTLKEFLEFVSEVTRVSYTDLIRPPQWRKSRGGSNNIPRARGYVVKAVLDNNIGKFSTNNIYTKIFGFKMDHSNAIHHRDIVHKGKELEMYSKIEEYIKTYNIKWEH